jgi:hypothetical protein
MVDGGRAQVRDDSWGQPRPVNEPHSWWREPKLATLATFMGQSHACDPLPDVPACLLDPLWTIPRLKQIKNGRLAEGELTEAQKELIDASSEQEHERWSPKPLVRSFVGTFEPYEKLGRLAKAEAYHRGFAAAARKVFLGDGHRSNWSIWESQFSDYTAILDLLHGLSYIYQAAVESTLDMEECWNRCSAWIRLTWQGQVKHVISELETIVLATETTSASYEKLQESLTYLKNNAERMRYDEYRRQGLPITTSLMESCIWQIGLRMKATHKFWGPTAEPQLQLCVDRLSETAPMQAFWERHQANVTGFRKSRATP